MSRCTVRKERGASLIVVLIVLAVLLLGSALVLRSGETVTLMAGNSAMRDAAVRAADLGINRAFASVQALSAEETDALPQYYATRQATDASGLPTAVAWGNVPAETLGNYSVQWVAERLCQGTTPVVDVYAQCQVSQAQAAGSNRGGWGTPVESDPVKYFRVTVRVTGPRGTEQFVQSLTAR